MDSEKFITKVFRDINTLRTTPAGHIKSFQNAITTISLFKGQESFIRDIEMYITFLKTAKPISAVNLNEGLCLLAMKQIEIFRSTGSITKKIEDTVLRSRADEIVLGYKQIAQIVDDGSEAAENVVFRLLFNKTDKNKLNRKYLFNESFKQIGIGYTIEDEENVVVIILADKADLIPKKIEYLEREDLDELKMAFDMFDVGEKGKIDPKSTINSIKALNLDKKNPALFKVLKELDTIENGKKGVDFSEFVELVTKRVENSDSAEGIKRIFDFFIDDSEPESSNDFITLTNLKKICTELGEDLSAKELSELISSASEGGNKLTYQMFYDYMTKYK